MPAFVEITVLLVYGLLSAATGMLLTLAFVFGTSGQARWMWSLLSGAGITGILAVAIVTWLGFEAWAKTV